MNYGLVESQLDRVEHLIDCLCFSHTVICVYSSCVMQSRRLACFLLSADVLRAIPTTKLVVAGVL